MSRRTRHDERMDRGFPRVSGDEPKGISRALGIEEFSPRERG